MALVKYKWQDDIRHPLFKPPLAKPIIAAMHGGLRRRPAHRPLLRSSKGTKFQVTEVARGIVYHREPPARRWLS
jgi:hypothetical protein